MRINRSPTHAAFSLPELLVVLAVVGTLAVIGLQATQKMRAASREAKGLSNLRQIGVTVGLYTADNNGEYPYGLNVNSSGVTFSDWALFLSATYLNPNRRNDYAGGAVRSEVFMDPGAIMVSRGSLHYAANPLLFVSQGTTAPVRLTRVDRPVETVIVMDAGQQPGSGSSFARAVNLPFINSKPTREKWNQSVSITAANNADTNFGAGSVRWRVKNGEAAKFLFADGHVSVLRKGELLYRHLWIDAP
jgi:prepilin-type N-terminal cleavage/methylation domain-containing protein/prepilin-type processing-associated H-X9-DG protein